MAPSTVLYDPELFAKVNLSLGIIPLLLDENRRFYGWRNEGKVSVVEIGSGTGCTTMKVLKPFLPPNFHELVCIDVCPKMHEFSKNRYNDPRVDFVLLDITEEIPGELEGRFDHLFSFYAFQCIRDQKKAFENIYKLLAPGGNILVTFIARNAIWDADAIVRKEEKWSKYLNGTNIFFNPYHSSSTPEEDCCKFAEAAGFTVKSCNFINRTWEHDSLEEFKEFITGVNISATQIPCNLRSDYIEEVIEHMRISPFVEENRGKIRQWIPSIVLFASKNM